MDIPAYMNFCPPDSVFFDRHVRDEGRFALADVEVPTGWRRDSDLEWVAMAPPGDVPNQGWKVHVTATPANAEEILRACWEHCIQTDTMFKFLRSTETLAWRSGKYGDRSASGKFVTIYPADEEALDHTLTELDARLGGREGPTILSDLRWREGPLYVRYGGFVRREMRTTDGEQVLAIEDPDGNLIPDERRPGFHPPEWAELPAILTEALEARNSGRLTDFPYRPTQAIHFSNGGGVYRGVDRDGRNVVLKEARPHAGLDAHGDDAPTRLERERWAMIELAELEAIPELIDFRIGHEHYFLVREDIDGIPLNIRAAELNPLLRPGAGRGDMVIFASWAVGMLAEVERVVAQMHERGIAYRDLHPGNILVGADDSLSFIDFEGARPVTDDVPQALGAPGYIAPPAFTGKAVDEYALGILAMDLLVPLAHVVIWGAEKVDELLAIVADRFPVPADYAATVRARLTPPSGARDGHATVYERQAQLGVEGIKGEPWPRHADDHEQRRATIERLKDGIITHATPGRTDRLYPGDPAQFASPAAGLGFLHGAAGVQWALHAVGCEVPEEHTAWLTERVIDAESTDVGLADGLGGLAFALTEIGHPELGRTLLTRAFEIARQPQPARVADGLAGLTLATLSVAERLQDPSLVAEVEQWVPRIEQGRTQVSRRWGPGLWGGGTGAALAHLRLHTVTGDNGLLDLAASALIDDLTLWGWKPGEPAPDNLRRSVTLESGGGVALALDALVRRCDAPALAALHRELKEAYAVPLTTEAGLLTGRAGLMTVLSVLGADPDLIAGHARDLQSHCVRLNGVPVVTGRNALRVTCDLATGAPGAMIALATLDGPVRLPFVLPDPDSRDVQPLSAAGADQLLQSPGIST